MAPAFRRAQLRGSDELFQPTRTDNGEPAVAREQRPAEPSRPQVSSVPEGRLVRLTVEEVQTLAEAVQRLKFPGHKPTNKPPVDEFERLEELRQKLLSVL
ncbi:MAG TPA: hypothetical protein VN193_05365 [Candidatus Angelobacter sp.]|jgi:hypothetical protein|nr:hypothetical protein [Candidatus Angelobacter sp.]